MAPFPSSISAGTPLNALPATLANHWTAGANKALGVDFRQSETVRGIQPPLLNVRNDTGSNQPRFASVTVGDAILDSSSEGYKNDRLFAGNALTTGVIAVYQEPVIDEKVGKAVVVGATPALVDVSSTSHEFVTVSGGKLVSSTSGSVRLITAPETGEDVLCWVLLQWDSPAGVSSGDGISCGLAYGLGTIPPTVSALFGNAHQAATWSFPTPISWLNTQGFSISTLKATWQDTGTTDWSGGASVNRWQSSPYTRTGSYASDDYIFHVVEDPSFGYYAWLELEDGTGNGTMDDELYLVWRCMNPSTPQPNYENEMAMFFGTNGTKTKADDPSFIVPAGKFFTRCCLNPGYALYDFSCFGTGAIQIPGEFSLNMPVVSGTELQTFALDMPDDCTYHRVGATCSGGRSDSSRIVVTQTGQLSAGGTVYVTLVIEESVGVSAVFSRYFKTANLSQSEWETVLAQGYVDVTYFTSGSEVGTTANCHDASPPTTIRLYFT